MISFFRNKYMYAYNVRHDHIYNFSQVGSKYISLEINDEILSIPEIDTEWDTAILKINIETTFLGKYFLPNIEIQGRGLSQFQSFEHNAKGIRYIDVSALIDSGAGLTFTAKNIVVPDQTAELQLFENPDVRNARVVVLSPHPDDAEIAAFGLYSSCDSNKTYIVTVTSGDGGEKIYSKIYDDAIQHYKKKGELRVWNSITVPLLGNILPEHAVNLGYFDGQLSQMYNNKSEVISSRYTESSDINHFRSMNFSNNLVNLNGTSR